MATVERLSDAQATRIVRLPESSKLDEWRLWVLMTARGERAPLDWFLALASSSNPTTDPSRHEPAIVEHLGRLLGDKRSRAASDGAVFRGYQSLLRSLGEPAINESATDGGAILGLFHQARMATFLPYRDGLIQYLAEVPISPEGALHAYVRVVAEWACRWPGLAVATKEEYRHAQVLYSQDGRTVEEIRRDRMRSRSGLPLIASWDLKSLLELVNIEAGNVGSAQDEVFQIILALDAVLSQLRYAIAMMARDPTLEPLSAANLARGEANEALGGALGRLRVRDQDEKIVTLRVLEEVRKYFLNPPSDVEHADEIFERAKMAERFHLLEVAVRAFGTQNKEEA